MQVFKVLIQNTYFDLLHTEVLLLKNGDINKTDPAEPKQPLSDPLLFFKDFRK